MKDIRERIGILPFFGEVALQVHLQIPLHEPVENQAVDSLRNAVGPVSRIEVCRARLEQKCHLSRFLRCLPVATSQANKTDQEETEPADTPANREDSVFARPGSDLCRLRVQSSLSLLRIYNTGA